MTGNHRHRKRYGIFACHRCHEFQYCNLRQKTKRCVKCRTTLILSEISLIADMNDIHEAIDFLQELKKQRGQLKGWGQLISADKLLKQDKK